LITVKSSSIMSPADIPPLTPERWLANLLEVAGRLSDKAYQERRWLAPDRHAWECPDEPLNELDDCCLDLFADQFSRTFSNEQAQAISRFQKGINQPSSSSLWDLPVQEILIDPRWEAIRESARGFIASFRDKWPQ
jgi:hypothetical protein